MKQHADISIEGGIWDFCWWAGKEIIGKEVSLNLELCLFWTPGYPQCQEACPARSRPKCEIQAIEFVLLLLGIGPKK